jgi:NAD-dependent SIR2 family protein deacetylase
MKLAVFLGAGASASDNFPIQNELFSAYFRNLREKDYESEMNIELFRFFKQIFNIDVMNDDMNDINFPTFEEVLGLLDLAEQRGESFRNFGLEDINKKSDSIRYMRQYLIFLMAEVLNAKLDIESTNHNTLIRNLIDKELLLDTTFISTNYDICIDNTIVTMSDKINNYVMLDYGIDFTNFNLKNSWRRPTEPSIKLYKIHGSLNWLYCPVCNGVTITPYEGGVMKQLQRARETRCLDCGDYTVPIVIPPTYFKNISNIHISKVWNAAQNSLRDADVVVFCGYSFPEADIHIKYLLKRVQGSRRKPPLKFVVYNNHEDKQEVTLKKEEKRYRRFLGENTVFTRKSFQDFAENPTEFL